MAPIYFVPSIVIFSILTSVLYEQFASPLPPPQLNDVVLFFCRYFDYLFYVDFDASMADQKAQNALRHLKVSFVFLSFENFLSFIRQ